ncbi:MAG TPA: hypothetical protein VII01_06285 [Solirubrobacteraceae bacterium]
MIAALAMGAIVVPAASAAIPEVGRCVRVANGAGAYRGSSCITHANVGAGKYEWMPATEGEKQKFTGSGNAVVVLSTGHATLRCVVANINGEYTGAKTAKVEIEFQACTNAAGTQCQTSQAAISEIKTVPLEAELGFIKNQPPSIKVGLDLKPKSPLPALAIYECGSLTETAHIEGSVIAQIKPIDKMTTESNLLFKVTRAGAQVPESFEGGPKDTLSTTFMTGLESTTAPSTLSMSEETGTNANALEIKAKEG